jgi:hypothetical protein
MLKSQCKGVEAAAITAALKAATNSDSGSGDGYGPGDALPDLETAWLLPGLIPAGDLTMLVATPKAGKTRFYLGLLAAMQRGDACLGNELPPLPPTLLIGTDMPRSLWRNYLIKSGLSVAGQVPAFMHKLYTLDRPLLLDAEGFRTIRTQCQTNPGMLVIVDSLRSCSRSLGIDENSAEASDLLYQLGEVVTGSGGTCLVVHHAPKSTIRDGSVGVAAIRGSSAIGGVPSQVLSLHHLTKQKDGYPVAQKDDPRRRLFAEGRFSAPLDLLVASDAEMRWVLHGDYSDYEQEQAAEKDAKRLTEGQGKLLELIQSNGPIEVKEAAEALAVDARTIRDQAKALETRGQIKRQPKGKGFLLVVADAENAEDPDAPTQGQIQLTVPPCPVPGGSAWDAGADEDDPAWPARDAPAEW